MRGLARGGDVVERRAFVEERRLRRIEIFRLRLFLQRAAAEGDDAAAQVGDRKHDAVAEAVVGHRNVVAGDQQAGLDHVLDRNAVAAEMLLQREALVWCVAEAEFQLRRRIEAAVGEIAARLGAGAGRQRRFKELRRQFHDVVERLAPRIALLVFARDLRQRHAGHLRQPLDRFREADAFRLHDEVEDRAVLARGEIEPGLLLVVDEEGRRLFLVERRQALELAPRARELDAPAHDFRHRQPGFQFVEKLGREAHNTLGRISSLTADSAHIGRLRRGWGRVFPGRHRGRPAVDGGPIETALLRTGRPSGRRTAPTQIVEAPEMQRLLQPRRLPSTAAAGRTRARPVWRRHGPRRPSWRSPPACRPPAPGRG